MDWRSSTIEVAGLETHYLEAGTGYPLILLHSGEFGASSTFSWEYNIDALSEHFRVIAPDWLGYGGSAKMFDFGDMWQRRVDHIAALLRMLGIDRAHFAGNSMGAGVISTVAALQPAVWPLDRIVIISGGGVAPDNASRQLLNNYDMTLEYMRRLVNVIILRAELRTNERYIQRRHEASLVPGAWECAAASRFRAPGRHSSLLARRPRTYATISCPALIIAGSDDPLRDPGYAMDLAAEIPGAALEIVTGAGHCTQIDDPTRVNEAMIEFLAS